MLGYFAVLFIVTINVIIETNNEYMHAGALFVRNLTNETYVIINGTPRELVRRGLLLCLILN